MFVQIIWFGPQHILMAPIECYCCQILLAQTTGRTTLVVCNNFSEAEPYDLEYISVCLWITKLFSTRMVVIV